MLKEDLMTRLIPRFGGIVLQEHLGREAGDYMTRWHLTPWKWWPFRRRWYLHVYDQPDNDPYAHDHPFGFRSFILWGGFTELVYPYEVQPDGKVLSRMVTVGIKRVRHRWMTTYKVPAQHPHRILKLYPPRIGGKVITLVLRGPKEQDWGFFVSTFEHGVVKVPSWEYIGLPEPEKPAYG